MATAKKTKEGLIKQLKNKNADVEHFLGLIDDYIYYFNQEKEMQKGVKEKGRSYTAISAAGNEYEKDNPDIKSAILYNKQKLSILKDLAINTDNVMSDDKDEL